MNESIKIDKFGIVKINRSEVKFISENNLVANTDKILSEALPMGKPPQKSYKISRIDSKFYLSYIEFDSSQDQGVGIVIELDDDLKTQSIKLFHGLDELINADDSIESVKSETALKIPFIPEEHVSYKDKTIFRNFDRLMFSLLAHFPIVVIGNHDEIVRNFIVIANLLPTWLAKSITYVTMTYSLHENVLISGIPPEEKLLNALRKDTSGNLTIIHMGKENVIAPFSSPSCKNIENAYIADNFEQARGIIADLYTKASNSADSLDAIIDTYNIPYGEAQLIMAIKGVLKGQIVKPSELKNSMGVMM